MATLEQYTFFKSQYDEENVRNNELTKRAEIYFSIVSLFCTAVLFKLKDLFDIIKEFSGCAPIWALIPSLASISISFFLIINSLKIREYEGVIDLQNYVDRNDTKNQCNEDFFEDRIADFIVAVERNQVVNDKKANLLILAGYFLMAGLLATLFFIVVLLLIKPH